MDVGSVSESAQISWKQVAVQKQERLRTGAEGETVREMVETVMPVLYTKEGSEKNFIIIDAAMNDLIRPAFYNSHHEIIPVMQNEKATNTVDIVGPICESVDFLATDREFPPVANGEYLAVLSAGAYGFVMSSNYNTRPRAAEVLVHGDSINIIKEREYFEDLIRGEKIPDFLSE